MFLDLDNSMVQEDAAGPRHMVVGCGGWGEVGMMLRRSVVACGCCSIGWVVETGSATGLGGCWGYCTLPS